MTLKVLLFSTKSLHDLPFLLSEPFFHECASDHYPFKKVHFQLTFQINGFTLLYIQAMLKNAKLNQCLQATQRWTGSNLIFFTVNFVISNNLKSFLYPLPDWRLTGRHFNRIEHKRHLKVSFHLLLHKEVSVIGIPSSNLLDFKV